MSLGSLVPERCQGCPIGTCWVQNLLKYVCLLPTTEDTSLGSLVSELDDAAPGDATPARDALRTVLAEVFNAHDFNKDGRMDTQEFRAAMRSMGDELSARVRCSSIRHFSMKPCT